MHLSSIKYLKILTVSLILCPFFCLEIDLKWDLNMTPLFLDSELPSLLALLILPIPLTCSPWAQNSLCFPGPEMARAGGPAPSFSYESNRILLSSCWVGGQSAGLAAWVAVVSKEWPSLDDISNEAMNPLQGGEYLYVIIIGTCVTYRSLGNSIFIFINFNYRSAIKFLILCCVKNAEINCSWQLIGLCFSLPQSWAARDRETSWHVSAIAEDYILRNWPFR